ncbi:MAG TPA: hypothetical protein VMQ60_03085 [Acidobacteriaceae bacterium]|jgi:hypothetical protein|nr:hypothetical protein [Acidobacteriaceae bacterium]
MSLDEAIDSLSVTANRIADDLIAERARVKELEATLTIIRDHTYPEGMQRSFAATALGGGEMKTLAITGCQETFDPGAA